MSRPPTRYARVHLTVLQPGDRSVGIPETWTEVSLKVGDPGFFDLVDRVDFERDLKAWVAQWFDNPKVFTRAELAVLERGEREAELDLEAIEEEYFRRLEKGGSR